MNRTNFVQTGGLPLKAERLQELQEAYSIFNNLGYLAGNFAILTGCEVVGTNVSDGVVVMNGEVILFQGGTITENVIIVETPINKEFKDGTSKPLHFIRYATFGTSESSVLWSVFKRVDPILTLMARLTSLEKKTAVFQAGGGMVLWNKPAAQIPEGWAEVVNWRGRIPVGMDVTQTEFNTLGKTGGSKKKTIAIGNLPPHQHKTNWGTSTYMPPDGYDDPEIIGASGANSGKKNYLTSAELYNGTNTPVGAQTQMDVMNPYRTVLFIEFIG